MEKTGFDDYSKPHEVTSTFRLNLQTLSRASSTAYETDACGLGWFFVVHVNGTVDGPVKNFGLYFKPGAFNMTASTGNGVAVTISPINIVKGPTKATLPTPGKKKMDPKARHVVGMYQIIDSSAQAVIFTVTVRLPKVALPTFPILTSESPSAPTDTVPPSIAATPATPIESQASSSSSDVYSPSYLQLRLQDALQKSLSGNIGFDDVKFVVFGRRVAGRRVGVPQAFHANSELLTGRSIHLDKLLGKGDIFTDHSELALSGNSKRSYVPAEKYGYDSDSDLESEWHDEEFDGAESPVHIDLDNASLSSLSSAEEEDHATLVEHSDQRSTTGHASLSERKPVIYIYDTAAQTYKALLYYIYTGEIQFKSLTSDMRAMPKIEASLSTMACSPKAMYRLADKLGIDELKALCKDKIKDSLHEENIVAELSSIFTSRYEEIREMQADLLVDSFLKSKKASSDLEVLMDSALTGEHAHSRKVLQHIFRRLLPKAL